MVFNNSSVTRILDLDLDFFLNRTAYARAPDGPRLRPEDYEPWATDRAVEFLANACGLSGKLPGIVVEHHGELFERWRTASQTGTLNLPLSVTHVDAHADLGLGDVGYAYLMTELLTAPVEKRAFPKANKVTDGNWLAFAIACRWVSELVYVLNGSGQPNDLLPYYMEGWFTEDWQPGFAAIASHIELPLIAAADLTKIDAIDRPRPLNYEPKIPFGWESCDKFLAPEPFDAICLARSPAFTPPESDGLFDEIRNRFIDEVPLL